MKVNKVESIVMEMLTKRYIGICEENNLEFSNYQDSCQEESINQDLEDKKRQIKRVYKKQSQLSSSVKIHKPFLSFE